MSIIGKEKYIKNIIHTCNVFNILSIHYYRLIRKQAFNNPLITNPHIADVPAIDEKNTKNILVEFSLGWLVSPTAFPFRSAKSKHFSTL